mmetsp:Transcript_30376/g.55060  ORF Transcript_30376/g.55060 Transcript_30376/m.55060 type:complete len:94 (-) Transcript_30376:173-454(-)
MDDMCKQVVGIVVVVRVGVKQSSRALLRDCSNERGGLWSCATNASVVENVLILMILLLLPLCDVDSRNMVTVIATTCFMKQGGNSPGLLLDRW